MGPSSSCEVSHSSPSVFADFGSVGDWSRDAGLFAPAVHTRLYPNINPNAAGWELVLGDTYPGIKSNTDERR
jgi:hypothetical protein